MKDILFCTELARALEYWTRSALQKEQRTVLDRYGLGSGHQLLLDGDERFMQFRIMGHVESSTDDNYHEKNEL